LCPPAYLSVQRLREEWRSRIKGHDRLTSSFTGKYDLACRFFSPTRVYPPASCLLAISNSAMLQSRPLSHRESGGDDSPELCYGNATRRVSKGARKPAEDSDLKTAFSMFRHDMYPHVTVSLEPGDAVVFLQDVVQNGVAYMEVCNDRWCISVRLGCWESFENAFPCS
jgi:hypothetical protein